MYYIKLILKSFIIVFTLTSCTSEKPVSVLSGKDSSLLNNIGGDKSSLGIPEVEDGFVLEQSLRGTSKSEVLRLQNLSKWLIDFYATNIKKNNQDLLPLSQDAESKILEIVTTTSWIHDFNIKGSKEFLFCLRLLSEHFKNYLDITNDQINLDLIEQPSFKNIEKYIKYVLLDCGLSLEETGNFSCINYKYFQAQDSTSGRVIYRYALYSTAPKIDDYYQSQVGFSDSDCSKDLECKNLVLDYYKYFIRSKDIYSSSLPQAYRINYLKYSLVYLLILKSDNYNQDKITSLENTIQNYLVLPEISETPNEITSQILKQLFFTKDVLLCKNLSQRNCENYIRSIGKFLMEDCANTNTSRSNCNKAKPLEEALVSLHKESSLLSTSQINRDNISSVLSYGFADSINFFNSLGGENAYKYFNIESLSNKNLLETELAKLISPNSLNYYLIDSVFKERLSVEFIVDLDQLLESQGLNKKNEDFLEFKQILNTYIKIEVLKGIILSHKFLADLFLNNKSTEVSSEKLVSFIGPFASDIKSFWIQLEDKITNLERLSLSLFSNSDSDIEDTLKIPQNYKQTIKLAVEYPQMLMWAFNLYFREFKDSFSVPGKGNIAGGINMPHHIETLLTQYFENSSSGNWFEFYKNDGNPLQSFGYSFSLDLAHKTGFFDYFSEYLTSVSEKNSHSEFKSSETIFYANLLDVILSNDLISGLKSKYDRLETDLNTPALTGLKNICNTLEEASDQDLIRQKKLNLKQVSSSDKINLNMCYAKPQQDTIKYFSASIMQQNDDEEQKGLGAKFDINYIKSVNSLNLKNSSTLSAKGFLESPFTWSQDQISSDGKENELLKFFKSYNPIEAESIAYVVNEISKKLKSRILLANSFLEVLKANVSEDEFKLILDYKNVKLRDIYKLISLAQNFEKDFGSCLYALNLIYRNRISDLYSLKKSEVSNVYSFLELNSIVSDTLLVQESENVAGNITESESEISLRDKPFRDIDFNLFTSYLNKHNNDIDLQRIADGSDLVEGELLSPEELEAKRNERAQSAFIKLKIFYKIIEKELNEQSNYCNASSNNVCESLAFESDIKFLDFTTLELTNLYLKIPKSSLLYIFSRTNENQHIPISHESMVQFIFKKLDLTSYDEPDFSIDNLDSNIKELEKSLSDTWGVKYKFSLFGDLTNLPTNDLGNNSEVYFCLNEVGKYFCGVDNISINNRRSGVSISANFHQINFAIKGLYNIKELIDPFLILESIEDFDSIQNLKNNQITYAYEKDDIDGFLSRYFEAHDVSGKGQNVFSSWYKNTIRGAFSKNRTFHNNAAVSYSKDYSYNRTHFLYNLVSLRSIINEDLFITPEYIVNDYLFMLQTSGMTAGEMSLLDYFNSNSVFENQGYIFSFEDEQDSSIKKPLFDELLSGLHEDVDESVDVLKRLENHVSRSVNNLFDAPYKLNCILKEKLFLYGYSSVQTYLDTRKIIEKLEMNNSLNGLLKTVDSTNKSISECSSDNSVNEAAKLGGFIIDINKANYDFLSDENSKLYFNKNKFTDAKDSNLIQFFNEETKAFYANLSVRDPDEENEFKSLVFEYNKDLLNFEKDLVYTCDDLNQFE